MLISALNISIGEHATLASVFPKFINGDYLITCIKALIFIMILIISATFVTLYIKKKNFLFKHHINRKLKALISTGILENSEDETAKGKIESFARTLNKPVFSQFTIDELIAIKGSIRGESVKNITSLYEKLGLKNISLKKLNSLQWFVKARGIQELYLMEQIDTLKKIYKNVNDKNEFVRMEAQVGIIHLTGFEGLRFLNVIEYILTEWQQIKLLERLRNFDMNHEFLAENIPKWLTSKNDSVIMFALKMAEDYQQYGMHDFIIRCLDHPNDLVRNQTIKALHTLADESTAKTVSVYYKDETYINKIAILSCLEVIATQKQVAFLAGLMEDPSDTIKLNAAKVLGKCSSEGLNLLEKMGALQAEPYQRIYLHVKQEIKR
ncbi:MAG: hypothetical protein NVSMB45_12920 [Ginsengibacter sp.]